MPTNRELREAASALSEELGVDASTDGLNNEKLTARVASLEAIKTERARTTSPTEVPPSDDASDAPSTAPPPPPEPAPAVQAMRDNATRQTSASNAEAARALRDEAADPKPSRWGYRIKEGYALYCAAGLLREHSEVNPRDFTTPEFQRHRNSGAIIETKLLPSKKK